MTDETATDALMRIKRNNPHGTEKEHIDAFREELQDPQMVEAMRVEWWPSHYRRINIVEVAPGSTVLTRIERERRDKRIQQGKQEYLERMKSITLMDLIMPNGKRFRDCTREELRDIGGWIGDVVKALKPGQVVGKHLTETDLWNIKMRNSRRTA